MCLPKQRAGGTQHGDVHMPIGWRSRSVRAPDVPGDVDGIACLVGAHPVDLDALGGCDVSLCCACLGEVGTTPRAANGEEDGYSERCGLRRPNKLRGHGAFPFLLPHAGSQTGWTAALAGASCSTVNPFARA